MLDFLRISLKSDKKGRSEVYPKFIVKKSKDLMIRGGDFYAIWNENKGFWSTDENDALQIIDEEIDKYVATHPEAEEAKPCYMWDAETGLIDKWHKYVQKQCRDNYHMLDENIIFSNTEVCKEDYASRQLTYPLAEGDISAWDKIIGTLYSPEERHKIEWAIGSVVTGDSKTIQKFMVLYGSAGTGKSTILNVIQQLFDGYCSVFDAKALGSSNNSFALEAFKNNPLVAIQHDGDLSRIEDNTRINSLVSHEVMTVNEKFKSAYSNRFKAFLFMGTNKPVKITDAKSGLIRRLIDVTPTGNKLSRKTYNKCVNDVGFELGAIAEHCKNVYLDDPTAYDNYIPVNMLGSTNDFYNFVEDTYLNFKETDSVSLTSAWAAYKKYSEDAKVPYPYALRAFKEELKNYFDKFEERVRDKETGKYVRNVYSGFKVDKFEMPAPEIEEKKDEIASWLDLKEQKSIFDEHFKDCPAQYASTKETPTQKWAKVTSKLSDLDTKKLHYVMLPSNVINIDFDLKNEKGEKDFELNRKAASLWPATYAELSKGGQGIHLTYIYPGDASKLCRVYDNDIEIKVSSGNSSLRRRLSLCNDQQIATISSKLPLKGEDKVVNFDSIKDEKHLRALIKKGLNRDVWPNTTPSVSYIKKILDEAYAGGLKYDVSDMYDSLLYFATGSHHQMDNCIKMVNEMHLKSDEPSINITNDEQPLLFFDCEVFPNLFLINWKRQGAENPVVRMINPSPTDVEELMKYRLVGFNCRHYDNHILYARMMGYTNEQLYNLSQSIINANKGSKGIFFSEAFNLSYTDVYDFASAGNKMSLKKWEIQLQKKGVLHIKHHELGLPWDQPVDESLWPKVAEYCDDDVIATEATFNHLKGDWTARQILADLAEGCVNDSTNTLTTKIIFGNNKKPQSEFHYRDMSQPVFDLDEDTYQFLAEACPEMMEKTHGEAGSLLPYFPGYKFEYGTSTYRGEDVGEGGFAQGVPGIYSWVALLDIASMHPHSLIAEVLFGIRYTKAFRDIVEGRVSIKHKAWDEVDNMMDGKLKPYIEKVKNGELTAKELANALKTAINSVYGLTSAKFENPFKDPRNVDNIVAKRGALFMIDLKNEVLKRGFKVAHIKTDSIKIPDATPEIIQFVMDFGKRYGYTFEHEATYEKMCLLNDAVYIAKFARGEDCQKLYGYIPDECNDEGGQWTATGKEFQIPYVFKTLFSKEPIMFEDMCETNNVQTAIYLDKNEGYPDVSAEEKELKNLESKYRKGLVSDTTFEPEAKRLSEIIATGHNYIFVGKVGEFTPVKPGCGGAWLVASRGPKYCSVTGANGYRWLESSMVKELGKEDDIDKSFYQKLVDTAAGDICAYGDIEQFCSDDITPFPIYADGKPVYSTDEEVPFKE